MNSSKAESWLRKQPTISLRLASWAALYSFVPFARIMRSFYCYLSGGFIAGVRFHGTKECKSWTAGQIYAFSDNPLKTGIKTFLGHFWCETVLNTRRTFDRIPAAPREEGELQVISKKQNLCFPAPQ